MVQAEGDEQAVRGAVDEGAQDRGAGNPVADPGQAVVEPRVDEGSDNADDDCHARRDDRDEPSAPEERQIRGQLDSVVFLVEQRGGQADDDATEHAVVDELLCPTCGRLAEHVGGQGIRDALEDQVPVSAASPVEPSGLRA